MARRNRRQGEGSTERIWYNVAEETSITTSRSGGMVDAPVSKTGGGNPVSVRIRPSAPKIQLQIETEAALFETASVSFRA